VFGVLTARRVRDITSPLSWHPAIADNKHWAKLPENHANMTLSGQKGLLINGSASRKQINREMISYDLPHITVMSPRFFQAGTIAAFSWLPASHSPV
jgi:hypothetical protein